MMFMEHLFRVVCRYVESNPQYAESGVYLVKFRQLQVLKPINSVTLSIS